MDTSETLVSRETTIALGLPPAGDLLREGGNKRQKNGRGVKRNQDRLKIGSLNVNGINNEQKRKEVVVQFSESDLDVLGLQETHLVGEGTEEGNKLWEGLRGIAGLSISRTKSGVRESIRTSPGNHQNSPGMQSTQ